MHSGIMAYRRRHGISRSSTFKEADTCRSPRDNTNTNTNTNTTFSSSSAPSSPLASTGIFRASDAHRRDSPLSSARTNSPFHSSSKEGGTNTIVDKRSQETFKLQNKKIEANHNEDFFMQNLNLWPQAQDQTAKPQTVQDHQLKASRDVAIATAAKAKLLVREIKTVKSDLAFAKERSCQLEEENKILREAREKGDHPADDDMIRLQLETLLAEKARLAHENAVYIRENSCLREIIKYHKLSMQDVVYLDESIEEVAEVNPSISRTLSVSSGSPSSPETVDVVDNPPLKASINHGGT